MEFVNSLVVLKPGMYILRHPGDSIIPLIISRGPGILANTGKLEILGTPATKGNKLQDSQDCIVAHVYDGDVDLLITACLPDKTVKAPGLRLDKIGLGQGTPIEAAQAIPETAQRTYQAADSPVLHTAVANQDLLRENVTQQFTSVNLQTGSSLLKTKVSENLSSTLANQAAFTIAAQGISIIGHIEGIGDQLAAPGQLLMGDLNRELRIEGIQLNWPDKPANLDLSYRLSIEGVNQEQFAKLGDFCGSRGQARRVTAIRLDLNGAAASEFALRGVACFSGGFRVPLNAGFKISGPSGFEHLTGLQVTVEKR